jgi:choline kinase
MECHKSLHTGMDSLNKRLNLQMRDTMFGTSIARSLYTAGSLMTVTKELSN